MYTECTCKQLNLTHTRATATGLDYLLNEEILSYNVYSGNQFIWPSISYWLLLQWKIFSSCKLYQKIRRLHFVHFRQETIFSFNISNKSYLLISWRIFRPSFKFYYSFGRLYHFGWPQFNGNDNLIKWYHVVSWYVAWRQIDYGELREALTDICIMLFNVYIWFYALNIMNVLDFGNVWKYSTRIQNLFQNLFLRHPKEYLLRFRNQN